MDQAYQPSTAAPADLTRVPFHWYQDPALLRPEQTDVFEGPVWNYLCITSEIPEIGDWRTTFVGRLPVVVVRTEDGTIAAFENRCLHRGALICFDNAGNSKDFTCVYHAWRYDLSGNLKSVAFGKGVNGKGGMPETFRTQDHAARKMRIATVNGIVFGTFGDTTPPIEDFLGPDVLFALRRNASKPLRVIGRFTEVLPNNWKMYAENVRDTYHASLLHVFFATFRINRLSQGGGVTVSDNGACHVSTTLAPTEEVDNSYSGMRSVDDELRLSDPSMLETIDEHGDRVRQQIIGVFPSFAMQRTNNVLAIRQFVPKGIDSTDLNWVYLGYEDDAPELRKLRLKQLNLAGPAGFVSMEDGCIGNFVERGAVAAPNGVTLLEMGGAGVESQETRATETAVRGFWQMWRRLTWAFDAMADLLTRLMQLNADYAATIDDDRLEAWPDFFVADCLYKITSTDNIRDGNEAGIVYADSRAMLADRVLALRRANIYERQTYRHIVGLPRIIDPAAMRAETPFLVIRTMRDGRMDLFVAGRYLDRLCEDAGSLRFQERLVVCNSARFDTLVAIPL